MRERAQGQASAMRQAGPGAVEAGGGQVLRGHGLRGAGRALGYVGASPAPVPGAVSAALRGASLLATNQRRAIGLAGTHRGPGPDLTVNRALEESRVCGAPEVAEPLRVVPRPRQARE